MTIQRKPFNVMLSDEERAALEALRVRTGARSQGDVIRSLIGSPSILDASAIMELLDLNPRVSIRTGTIPGNSDPKSSAPVPLEIQVGPTKPKPGSMLKVKK